MRGKKVFEISIFILRCIASDSKSISTNNVFDYFFKFSIILPFRPKTCFLTISEFFYTAVLIMIFYNLFEISLTSFLAINKVSSLINKSLTNFYHQLALTSTFWVIFGLLGKNRNNSTL